MGSKTFFGVQIGDVPTEPNPKSSTFFGVSLEDSIGKTGLAPTLPIFSDAVPTRPTPQATAVSSEALDSIARDLREAEGKPKPSYFAGLKESYQ